MNWMLSWDTGRHLLWPPWPVGKPKRWCRQWCSPEAARVSGRAYMGLGRDPTAWSNLFHSVQRWVWDPLSWAKKNTMIFSVFSTSVCAQILEEVCATGLCVLSYQPVPFRLPHTHLLYCLYTYAYTHTPIYIQNISTYWALSNILSP